MKVLIIGATGTVGRAVVKELGSRHEIIEVGHARGAQRVDITDIASVTSLFSKLPKVDAVISAAGKLHFGALADMTSEQFSIGLHDKLRGQVHVALVAQKHLNDRGSITLTSGILSDEPIAFGANASAVNSAVDGFVRGAAVELQRGIRINAVSPTLLTESVDSYGAFFRGYVPAPAARVALAYSRSVEGAQTGQIYRVW